MTNAIIPSNIHGNQATMTSREIADLVGSRHDDTRRSIERLAGRGVITLPPMAEKPSTGGRPSLEYVFSGEKGKRDSLVVVAQLSPEFTARVIDRWQELEQQQNPVVPKTYAAALIEAGRLAQLAEEQAEQLALAAPKVEFVERYVEASGDKGFREVCKLLKVKEPEFRQFLSDRRVMYRLGGQWMPYQNHIEAGRFTVKTGVANNDHAYNTAKFTPKGIEWVAGEWAKHSLGVFS